MSLPLRILVCLLLTWLFLRLEGRPLASVGLRLDGRFARGLLVGALGGVTLMVLTTLVIALAGGVHLARTPGTGPGLLLRGAWLFLCVAFSEELAFRGYFFQHLAKWPGPWAAQGAMGLLFALAHWGNPGMRGATLLWATLNIALASVLLGLCYLRSGSLAQPMGLHLGWNWAQGTLLGFGVSGTLSRGWWTPVFHGRPAWQTGGSFGLEASLPCTVLCVGACILLALWRPRPAWTCPAGSPPK